MTMKGDDDDDTVGRKAARERSILRSGLRMRAIRRPRKFIATLGQTPVWPRAASWLEGPEPAPRAVLEKVAHHFYNRFAPPSYSKWMLQRNIFDFELLRLTIRSDTLSG